MRTNETNEGKSLFECIAQGDESAFRLFYEHTISQVYNYHYFLTRSTFQAEELSQEFYINLWGKREQLYAVRDQDSWIKVVMRNHAYNYLQKRVFEQRQFNALAEKLPGKTLETEDQLLDKENHILFRDAINRLPAQQKNVFLLSRQKGLKHNEIAASLGISTFTVKNHMKAALHSISLFLKDQLYMLVLIIAKLFF